MSSLRAIMEMLIYDEITFIFLKTMYDLSIEHHRGSGCFYYFDNNFSRYCLVIKKSLGTAVEAFVFFQELLLLSYFIFQTTTIIRTVIQVASF